MNAFDKAINQSNYGASLIEAGNYADAVHQLTEALSAFKHVMNQTSVSDEVCAPLKTSLDKCMEDSSSASQKSIDEEMQGQFMYKQAITIPRDIGMGYKDGVMVSCMIIFNLAMAYHLHGAEDPQENVGSLVRSLKLYELSFNLQREEQFENNVLFTLSVVNNLGLVHRLLQDDESATKCFEHVLSTLMYLTDCGEASKAQLQGFFVNLTDVISQSCVAPAA
jgi:hypothetical protein